VPKLQKGQFHCEGGDLWVLQEGTSRWRESEERVKRAEGNSAEVEGQELEL